jgi:hypothetical protein
MKIQFKKYFFSVMSLLILSCILIGCGESVERFEKENVDGAELRTFLKSNIGKKVYLNIKSNNIDGAIEFFDDGIPYLAYFSDTSQITDFQISKLRVKISKLELARRFIHDIFLSNTSAYSSFSSLFDYNNTIPDVDLSDEVNVGFHGLANTGKLVLDFSNSPSKSKMLFAKKTEDGFSVTGFFMLSSTTNPSGIYTLVNIPDNNDSKIEVEPINEATGSAPSGKNLSESNNESSSPVSEPKKELDFETYLHNTTFRLGNNGRVNFQRNGKVSITGGRADLLGGYEIYDNQAVITKLQAVYGNFDASNNNGSSGYVKLNSNGSLSMTLSDGNETQSYTLEPI